MNCNLQMMREKLDNLLLETTLDSKEVLDLSKEIDILILEYYKKQSNFQEDPGKKI